MNDSYKFLGTISAVNAFANADENYYVTLAVFSNNESLKIYLKDLEVIGNTHSTKEDEVVLNNITKSECYLIAKNFSDNLIKKLVLAKLSEHIEIGYGFDIVY